jgi:hypothetical protein
MTIEGVPEGWELVRLGSAKRGEWYMLEDGSIRCAQANHVRGLFDPIVRKIEKPKRYRPFASAEEFRPFKGCWITINAKHCPELFLADDDLGDTYRIEGFNEHSVCIYVGWCTYQAAFGVMTFDDGTPFGIEVTE